MPSPGRSRNFMGMRDIRALRRPSESNTVHPPYGSCSAPHNESFIRMHMPKERRFMRLKAPVFLLGAILLPLIGNACSSSPAYMGLESDELFQYAERALEREEWSEAIASFQRFVNNNPTDPRLPEARINLGHAFFGNGEELSASAEYIRMLERFPGHERAPEAALGVCRAYAEISPIPQRDQTYTEQAIVNCERLLRDYPQSAEAEEGREIRDEMVEKLARKAFLNGEYYFRNGWYDSAIIYFDQVVDRYPDTSVAPRALLMTIRSYEEIGWDTEAEEARERLLRLYPDSEAAREVGNAGDDRAVNAGDDGVVNAG